MLSWKSLREEVKKVPSPKTQNLQLLYEGSVKHVFQSPYRADRLLFEYTDDYSVFDWGKMPDTIANKGISLVAIGAFFFEELARAERWSALSNSPHLKQFDKAWLKRRWEHQVFNSLTQNGSKSHFQDLVLPNGQRIKYHQSGNFTGPVFMEVLKAEVDRPVAHQIMGQSLYFYPQRKNVAAPRLVPLEVVFRFGMPTGSSLKGRIEKDPDYVKVLGLSNTPEEGKLFEHPVIEFFTKLEPKDRLLTMQEAAHMSGLNADQFEKLCELALDLALALYVIFAERGIELWDGKFEFVLGAAGIMLADSIGPDELRLLYKGCHLSKELIRQVYRGGKWESAIKEAQQLAKSRKGADWKDVCRNELNCKPEPLPSVFKAVVDKLYGTLTNHIVGQEIFKDHPSLDGFIQALPTALPAQV